MHLHCYFNQPGKPFEVRKNTSPVHVLGAAAPSIPSAVPFPSLRVDGGHGALWGTIPWGKIYNEDQ